MFFCIVVNFKTTSDFIIKITPSPHSGLFHQTGKEITLSKQLRCPYNNFVPKVTSRVLPNSAV